MSASYYRHHVFVCTNTRPDGHPKGCCGEARGLEIRARFAQALSAHGLQESCRANKAGCFERCAHGPVVVVYPDAIWYRVEDPQRDVEAIVSEHLLGGRPVERLMLPPRDEAP